MRTPTPNQIRVANVHVSELSISEGNISTHRSATMKPVDDDNHLVKSIGTF
jgi:hypothetical protein